MAPDLFTPLTLRPGVTARNRTWLAPLTNRASHADGTLSDGEATFLARRAAGGFGVVETCAAYVSPAGKTWGGELGVHDDATLPGLTRLASALHAHGALACVQLFHGGLRASPEVSGHPTLGASAIAEPGLPVPRAATEADLEAVIGDFADAARRCAHAGMDAVEVHAAHGYLLSQFLSARYNQRADAWGGPLEHRARLLRAVVSAVRAAAPELVLAVRLSPEDFGQARGLDLDESLWLARALVEDGVDVLHLSLWDATRNTAKRPDAHPIPLFRAAVGAHVPLVAAGGVWQRADAEALLALGADAVAVGRAAIAWHDWPARVADGRPIGAPPFTPEHLAAEGLPPAFVDYMRGRAGFMAP